MLYDYPFENDSQAIHNLEQFNVEYKGGLIKLVDGFDYPMQVLNAADYLCDEWDYAVEWVKQ